LTCMLWRSRSSLLPLFQQTSLSQVVLIPSDRGLVALDELQNLHT